MTARKAKREYYTITWELPDGQIEGMTVPTYVAWTVARAIAAENHVDDVTITGVTGNAKVFRDGKAYVKRKGEAGEVIEAGTVAIL